MLIQYPTSNWDTFLSLVEADLLLGTMTDIGSWATMTDEEKSHLLVQTASQIRLCQNITLPATLEGDLMLGHGYLLLQASRVDMTEYDHNEKDITGEKVGSIAIRYAYRDKNKTISDIPPMATMYLKQYGCGGNAGFSQSDTHKA